MALRLFPPEPGERVIDLGCGFGDTTQRIAGMVGSGGEAFGVDVAPRFIAKASERGRGGGARERSFAVADLEATVPSDGFDHAFSRMGTMFFANPGAAMRNVLAALRPGGLLCMVVWRSKEENP